MKKPTRFRLVILSILLLIIFFVSYEFLFGKLFAFSPVIIGFNRTELKNITLLAQEGAEQPDLSAIDSLIPSIEDFHELSFTEKPELFIFRDSSEYLSHSVSKARFCAFSSGRLFISPWALREAAEGKISLEVYLAHELSHILIFQHKGLLSEFSYPEWLLEGIAVYSSNQMGTGFYPSKPEVCSLVAKGNYMPPEYFKTGKEDEVKLEVPYRMTFIYSEFGTMVDYLISKHGKASFIRYMKALIDDNDHDRIFREVFGCDFGSFQSEFREYIMYHEKQMSEIEPQGPNFLINY